MKTLATLVCLLVVTASYAQESPAKEKSNSPQRTGDMPILKGHGNALDMPTRNGKGEATAIPNRPTPVPWTSEEYNATLSQALVQLDRLRTDPLNQERSKNALPTKKD